MPFHLSDSILGGKKETLIGVCETLIKSIISKDFIYEGIDIRIRAEVAFFASYLKYKKTVEMRSWRNISHYIMRG